MYVVDALTFGEAEETITKEMEPFATGEFEVKAISPAAYGEIFFSDSETDDHWYKAKLSFRAQCSAQLRLRSQQQHLSQQLRLQRLIRLTTCRSKTHRQLRGASVMKLLFLCPKLLFPRILPLHCD